MRNKTLVLLASYSCAAIIILAGFVYSNYKTAQTYRLYIDNQYQHAFAEVVTSVEGMDTALQKSLYSTTPSMMSSVCTEVFGEASAAQMAMGELPFSNYELEHISSFISKVGDYSYALSRKAATGEKLTDEEYNNLTALSEAATMLSNNLTQLLADINDGKLTISELKESKNKASSSEDNIVPTNLANSFQLMETEFPEIPSLIYDGPFSEHIKSMTPVMIEGKQEISVDEAKVVAAEFMGLKPEIFSAAGQRDDTVPVYIFTAKVDGGDLIIEVTKCGGFVLNLVNTRAISNANIKAEDAVKIALDFLAKQGYDSMKTSYWIVRDSSIIINFAYTQEGVICYPDLIKVSVALDNGRITGFESLGYIMSHRTREIAEAKISEEEALKNVSNNLTVLSHNYAIIPTSGKNEVFCHEFKCEAQDGRHYIVYINAASGNEEKILILLEDENGTLTL